MSQTNNSAQPFSIEDVDFDDVGFHPKQGSVYVYVIVCIGTTFLKIGLSSNPRRRVLSMQTGNPNRLMLAYVFRSTSSEIAFQVEKRAHHILESARHRGEWFHAPICDVVSSIDRAAKEVRNRRGELGHNKSLKRSIDLGWDYAE